MGGARLDPKHVEMGAERPPPEGRRGRRRNKCTKQVIEGGHTPTANSERGVPPPHPPPPMGGGNREEWKRGKIVWHVRGKDGVVRVVTLLHRGHYYSNRPASVPTGDKRKGASDRELPTKTNRPNGPESEDKQLKQPERRSVELLRTSMMTELCLVIAKHKQCKN